MPVTVEPYPYGQRNHYTTIEVDIEQLYRGRDDADARMVRYITHEVSDWRVKAQNLELYVNRILEALEERGLKHIDWDEDLNLHNVIVEKIDVD